MADQYLTVSVIARDEDMRQRVAACVGQQGGSDPVWWTEQNSYTWAAAPGWGEKWDSAVAGGVPNPGADPAVIPDSDILSQVQLMLGSVSE